MRLELENDLLNRGVGLQRLDGPQTEIAHIRIDNNSAVRIDCLGILHEVTQPGRSKEGLCKIPVHPNLRGILVDKSLVELLGGSDAPVALDDHIVVIV